MTKVFQTLSVLSLFFIAGAASADEVLNTDQLDKVTASGVASAEALASAAAQSLTGNNASAFTETAAFAFEDANDQEHSAAATSVSRVSAGN